MTDLKHLQSEIAAKLAEIQDLQALESLRIFYLGRKGQLAELFREMAGCSKEDRPRFGQELNELKGYTENAFQAKQDSLSGSKKTKSNLDETLPGVRFRLGRLHPITQTIQEITDIFSRFGFEIVDGREIETEFYNFTALNIPLDHPSRDAFDTFYTEQGHLLRSQTSTVQIRTMENRKPPIRILAPGKVYRPDAVDASHSFMFHQIEGLLVDESTTFSDLKGMIHLFLRKLFGKNIKMRFKPHFFPFTEPSVDVDISWGKGWLEIMGAGQVDPAVFKQVGYNPDKVQGFAFGLGVERIAMLKYAIKDIRLFFENDLRFLEQFKS